MAINRKNNPEFHIPKKLELVSSKRVIQSDGIPVYLIKTGTELITRIDFIFQAGTRHQDALFVAGTTNTLLSEGTSTLSGARIAEKIDYNGSYVYPFFDRDEAGISIYSLDKQLESTLDLVLDMIQNSIFPESEIEVHKNRKIQSLLIDQQRAERVASKGFNKKLFGEQHPYGVFGEIEDISKITRKDLVSFHEKFYRKDNLTIIITGPECDNFLPILENGLSKLEILNDPQKTSLFPKPTQEPGSQIYQTVENATQAAIRIGRIIPNRSHPDHLLLAVLNTIFGGYFGSRLMQNIREKKGYTYGIGSALISLKELSYLSIASNVGPDVFEQTISECYKEMEFLQNELVSEAELARVKNYMIGDLQRQLDGPFGVADVYKSLIFNNIDISFINQLLTVIRNCSSEEIRLLAQQYLNPKDFKVSIAGPKKQ